MNTVAQLTRKIRKTWILGEATVGNLEGSKSLQDFSVNGPWEDLQALLHEEDANFCFVGFCMAEK